VGIQAFEGFGVNQVFEVLQAFEVFEGIQGIHGLGCGAGACLAGVPAAVRFAACLAAHRRMQRWYVLLQ
jgi:hypothetical protein